MGVTEIILQSITLALCDVYLLITMQRYEKSLEYANIFS